MSIESIRNGHAVWKQWLQLGKNELWLPRGARFLSLHRQHGKIQSWWLVSVKTAAVNPPQKTMYIVHGYETGQWFTPGYRDLFMGTVLTSDDNYVLHFFWNNGKDVLDDPATA